MTLTPWLISADVTRPVMDDVAERTDFASCFSDFRAMKLGDEQLDCVRRSFCGSGSRLGLESKSRQSENARGGRPLLGGHESTSAAGADDGDGATAGLILRCRDT